jgi:hypothetical protein
MWSNHEYHICVSKFLSHFHKQQKGYLVITLGYHLRNIAQGEKQSKKKKGIEKKISIQIQGKKLGVHVDHLKIFKLLLKRLNTS